MDDISFNMREALGKGEGTFGYTRDAIQAVFDATTSVETAQRILGKTAIDLFNMRQPDRCDVAAVGVKGAGDAERTSEVL